MQGSATHTLTSMSAYNNGPKSQNKEYRQYRVHCFGYFGGPGMSAGGNDGLVEGPCDAAGYVADWQLPDYLNQHRRKHPCVEEKSCISRKQRLSSIKQQQHQHAAVSIQMPRMDFGAHLSFDRQAALEVRMLRHW